MTANHNKSTSNSENSLIPKVGDEIRTVRKARQLTLKDLSARAGCSVAYLSRIERGDARISVDLLTAIGDALNVDPKWFFPSRTGDGDLEKSCVVRANSRRPLSNMYTRSTQELGFEDELLSSSLAGDCYMMISRFPPQSEATSKKKDGFTYQGEQHAIITQGQVELTLGDEVIILNPGDSFSYSTEIPHRLRNYSDQEAIMISTMTPVRITW